VRVLVVIDSLAFGGAENSLVTLAVQAPRLGLDLEVISLAPPTDGRSAWLPRLRAAGLEPRFLDVDGLLRRDTIPRLASIIRRAKCDVVHAHLEVATALGPLAARLARRPAVSTLHHVPGPLSRRAALRERLAVAVASRSAGLILVSQASSDAFAARYPRLYHPARWQVIRNGVDVSRYRPIAPGQPRDLPPELGIPTGAPVVALAGNMRPGKGHEVALRAWAAVHRDHPQARLLFLGDGRLEGRLRALVADLGLTSSVVFAGMRDDLHDLLPRTTLAVLPTSMEALPTVVLEAGASGVPTIATAVGGVPETIVDGRTGWLVDAATPELFAAALRSALADPAEIARRGRAARALVEQRFDAAGWADRLADCYRGAAGGRALAAA
jgi:glycosyltransferase involved in cell wall biosynthesis